VFKAGWMAGQGLTDEAMYEEDGEVLKENFDTWLQAQVEEVDVLGWQDSEASKAITEGRATFDELGTNTVLALQCVDCRDYFSFDIAEGHAREEVCIEWGNHAMYEANFRVVRIAEDRLQRDA